jgi:benzoyl-CoA reductase/2-hydroxyglutaryl-CoA dehydratase subunit BcrC/BadD/HgdB
VTSVTIMEELAQEARTRPEKLKELQKKGAKAVGYMGRYVPEELIHAAGAAPYLICRGGEPEPPDAVIPYLLRFMSPFNRAQIGYHILGLDPVMPMFDVIVMQSTDCQEARLADVFEYLKLPTARLGVPPDWEKDLSRDYYRHRLAWLKETLEKLTGNKITDAGLKDAIEAANGVRGILSKISRLRKQQPPPIGGYDFIRLNHYAFYNDPAAVTGKLNDLYNELQKAESPFAKDAPRILLAGHAVAVGDYVAPKLIEDSGGVIAAEFLDEGVWHCDWNVKTEGDLMQNIIETYYLERTPPTIFQPAWENRLEVIKRLIKEYDIDGVVWYQLSFEEIYDMESYVVAKSMEEMKMPFLRLESSYEYSREAMGPLTTRIESFIEATRQKKGQ